MFCNDRGIELIKSFEKCVLHSYKDQGGILTIGYGQTGPFVTEDMTCTQEQADAWFNQQIQMVQSSLSRMIKVSLGSNKFSALCALAYNIGLHAFSSSSLLMLLNKGEYDEVPNQIARWNKVNREVSLGLVHRRNAEIELWNMPDVV